MTNRTYDILVWMAQIVLPALATLVVALSEIWGFDKGTMISATIMAVDAYASTAIIVAEIMVPLSNPQISDKATTNVANAGSTICAIQTKISYVLFVILIPPYKKSFSLKHFS